MRFPPKSYHKDLESVEVRPTIVSSARICIDCIDNQMMTHLVFQDRREREQQDIEYAKEMADEDDDAFP